MRKGNEGENGALRLLAPLGQRMHRPRTTSHRATDTGDIHGLPLVVSVKNWATVDLPHWLPELEVMVQRSPHNSGVVIAKRRGRANPEDWYVITSGGLALPMLWGYIDWCERNGEV
jgi:hypothetical protein